MTPSGLYYYSVGSSSATLAGNDANHYFVVFPSIGQERSARVWVLKDDVEAYKWFLLAGAQGSQSAQKHLELIELSLSGAQRAEGQRLAREFKPRREREDEAISSREELAQSHFSSSGTGFLITTDGFLITNEHVVKEAVQVRLVTGAGIIAAKVVKVDAANDLALLPPAWRAKAPLRRGGGKAEGRFAALPVVASRAIRLGSTVATVGFPNVGLQGFAPKLARGGIAALSGVQDDARHFSNQRAGSRAIRAARWWMSAGTWWAWCRPS